MSTAINETFTDNLHDNKWKGNSDNKGKKMYFCYSAFNVTVEGFS